MRRDGLQHAGDLTRHRIHLQLVGENGGGGDKYHAGGGRCSEEAG